MNELIYMLLLAIGCIFFLPFIYFPPDPHFGSFSMWAMFQKQNESIPKEVILGNAGLSRIFLHYIVKWTAMLLGKRSLHIKVRWVQAGHIILTGLVMFYLSRAHLAIDPVIAITGIIIFYYISSRPQFLFTYINAEPFYSFFAVTAIAALFHGWQNPSYLNQGTFIFSFLIVFFALNSKPCYLIDFPSIAAVSFLVPDTGTTVWLSLFVGGGLGILLWICCLKNHLYQDSLKWMFRYNKEFSFSFSKVLLEFKKRYLRNLSSTPFLQLCILAFAGILLGPCGAFHISICLWAGSSLIALFVQGRFELYHFSPVLIPLSLLGVIGIQRLWELNGLLACMALAVLFYRPKALKEFLFYYSPGPSENKIAKAIPNYIYYWDFRIHSIAEAAKKKNADFIAWGIVPQVHYLANKRPITSYTFFHHWMGFLYTPWKSILIRDTIQNKPEWIYDFNAWNKHYGPFNALAFFTLTGLAYTPVKREQNLVYYRLGQQQTINCSNVDDLFTNTDIYVRTSPYRDLFLDELKQTGFTTASLPVEWKHDICHLVEHLIKGEFFTIPELAAEERLLWREKKKQHSISWLYGAVIFFHRKDMKKGQHLLSEWIKDWKDTLVFFPILNYLTSLLLRFKAFKFDNNCGSETKFAIGITAEELNCLPPEEALMIARVMMQALSSNFITIIEKQEVTSTLNQLKIDMTPYSNTEITASIIKFKQQLKNLNPAQL